MARGETVKYIIDADTSGFSRGMALAAAESKVAGREIEKNLGRTAGKTEDNFQDIRRNAQTAASQIRNFGVALSAFNVTSAIIGITALTGAILELSGAIAAAGSTALVLVPALLQGAAGALTYKTAVTGLGDAFKALSKNDGEAWVKAMEKLGPAAQEVARAAGGIRNAFKSIQLNTQAKLWDGIGESMLKVGAGVLPVINEGMQQVAASMNGALKAASDLASTPLFRGFLAQVFQDTAENVTTLTKAIGPLLTIFTQLYFITRPYVELLSQWLVDISQAGAAYLSSAKGQAALTLSIQEGIVALKQLGGLVSSVFGLLTSVFRTSVNSGNSLISTLTEIIHRMTDWVNSAEGQAKLIALFNFTSLAITAVANAAGLALGVLFNIVETINNLNPALQSMVVGFLAASLTIRPLISYLAGLWLAIRTVAVTAFNFAQQAVVLFGALGFAASFTLVLAGALIVLANVIKGPLGGALLIIGTAVAAYIGLSYWAAAASATAAEAFWAQGVAALQLTAAEGRLAGMNVLLASTMYHTAAAAVSVGAGMSLAARAAVFLQAALIPLLILAASVVVILSMLGVFGSGTKKADDSTKGFSASLASLQKAMKGVNSTGVKTSNNGLSALSNSLGGVADSADQAKNGLASFDKMNVLTDSAAAAAGGGISGLPGLPDLGGAGGGLAMPPIDTADFDKSIADMEKNFAGLQKTLAKPMKNPLAALGDWINAHPWVSLVGLGILVAAITALFVAFGFAAIAAVAGVGLTIGLIILAIAAVVAIIILLWKNWDTVWGFIKDTAASVWKFLQNVWDGIMNGAMAAAEWVGEKFANAWEFIKGVWGVVAGFFSAIFEAVKGALSLYVGVYVQIFRLGWQGIVAIWSAAGGFFSNVWGNIQAAFSSVIGWFGEVFSGAWTAVKNAFTGVVTFFSGIWNSIKGIFGSIGVAIADSIGGAFKGIINTAVDAVTGFINTVIRSINSAIGVINKIPGVSIKNISTISLPKLAKGGIITAPTVAELGEAGTEAVMPLENNTQWIDKLASKINSANGAGNGQPIQLIVQIGEDKVASKVIDLINERTQMSGRNAIYV